MKIIAFLFGTETDNLLGMILKVINLNKTNLMLLKFQQDYF